MNILICLDFSEGFQKIIDEAKALAQDMASKVWLLHVAEAKPGMIPYTGSYVDYGSGFIDYGPDPKALRDQIAQKFHTEHKDLQDEAQALRNLNIKTTALLIQGSVIKTILQEAEKLSIDMIVLGSHGHGAVYNLLVGSVSEGVIKNAACPVLVVPTHDRSEQKDKSKNKT